MKHHNYVEDELQRSRVLSVMRKVSEAVNLAYELGKSNARMRYTEQENPFADYPVEGVRRAWASGLKDGAE